MLLLKGCPRCRGDLLLIRYDDEHTLSCLQCGFTRALAPARARRARAGARATPSPSKRPRSA